MVHQCFKFPFQPFPFPHFLIIRLLWNIVMDFPFYKLSVNCPCNQRNHMQRCFYFKLIVLVSLASEQIISRTDSLFISTTFPVVNNVPIDLCNYYWSCYYTYSDWSILTQTTLQFSATNFPNCGNIVVCYIITTNFISPKFVKYSLAEIENILEFTSKISSHIEMEIYEGWGLSQGNYFFGNIDRSWRNMEIYKWKWMVLGAFGCTDNVDLKKVVNDKNVLDVFIIYQKLRHVQVI